jgi:uncharacterized protein YcbX
MTVAGLWRYPVKSMQGVTEGALPFDGDGAKGDRAYGVLDITSGTIISAKRDGRLLMAAAWYDGGEPNGTAPPVVVGLPSGEMFRLGAKLDDAVTEWLGRPCRLVSASEHGPGTFENPLSVEAPDDEVNRWTGPPGSFVDSSPVHLITTSTLEALRVERPDLDWATRRFRPNVVIATTGSSFVEQEWVGQKLAVGQVELLVTKPCTRCVMVTRPQPDGVDRSLDVLRHVNTAHAQNVGVLAKVITPGRIVVGETVVAGGRAITQPLAKKQQPH